MMKVIYSAAARRDLSDIYEYIAYELLEEKIAKNQAERIMKAIRTLEEMPLRCRLYDSEPWRSKGLRALPVDNYQVFYLPKEAEASVEIVRIMYGGRDTAAQLNE